jgi:hypothetical protein
MLKVAVSVSYLCRVVAFLPRQAIEIWFVSERAVIHFRNVERRRPVRYIGHSNGAIESAKCVHHVVEVLHAASAFSSAENRTGRISLVVTPPLPDFSTRMSICASGRPVGITSLPPVFSRRFLAVLRSGRGR